ncbi:TPA: hypothetical protein RSW75_003498 [Vibrio cholerae]|nr:hypothetical protein VCSRO209_3463 [Vibrio cholerae]HDZ3771271.1 hypothetical protein [Vibrio cholerae]
MKVVLLKLMVKVYANLFRKKKLNNVLNAQSQKKVLLSYIQQPFIMRKYGLVSFKHTNFDEALAIADIFDSLGYRVDVIDYNCESKIDYSQYDIIFGFGEPFQRSFSSSKKLIRIFYGTGMNVNVQNANAMLRLYDFYSKHSIWLPSSVRYVSKQWALQYSFSDTILALGNQYCADSYRKFTLKSEVYQIPSFYYQRHDAAFMIEERRKNNSKDYLWFGTSGAIHKGLDLILNYFIENDTEQTLHVCGLVEQEHDFFQLYKDKIETNKNIQYHGFIDIDSREFLEILLKCAFIIYPSCSEGGSPSVLNCVGNGGLLPIITRETTIDVDGSIIIDSFSEDAIIRAISYANSLTQEELTEKQTLALESVQRGYTFEHYKRAMKEAISTTLINTHRGC